MRVTKSPLLEINLALNSYRQAFQGFLQKFNEQGKKDSEYLESHRNDWKRAYFEQVRNEKIEENLARIRPAYEVAHKEVFDKTAFYLSVERRRIDQYYLQGARPEFSSRLMGYESMGFKPSKRELDLIASDCISYAERMLLKSFILRAYTNEAPEIVNPYTPSSEKDTITDKSHISEINMDLIDIERYNLNTADIDKTYQILDRYAELVNLCVSHYCAENEYLYRLTGNAEELDTNLAERNAYVLGDDTDLSEPGTNPVTNFAVFGANASRFWDSDIRRELESQIDEINGSMQRTADLTANEREILTAIFGTIPSYSLKDCVPRVAEADPRLCSLIELSPEYGKYLD